MTARLHRSREQRSRADSLLTYHISRYSGGAHASSSAAAASSGTTRRYEKRVGRRHRRGSRRERQTTLRQGLNRHRPRRYWWRAGSFRRVSLLEGSGVRNKAGPRCRGSVRFLGVLVRPSLARSTFDSSRSKSPPLSLTFEEGARCLEPIQIFLVTARRRRSCQNQGGSNRPCERRLELVVLRQT